MTKPDGTVVSNAYDFAGRLASVNALRDGESESIAYTYDYDEIGFVGSATRDGKTVNYYTEAFMKSDEFTSESYVYWTYDNDFRVSGVTLDGVADASYAYNDDGALVLAGDLVLNRDAATGFLTNTVVGNIADSREFNGFGEISGYAASAGGSSLYAVTYAHDALGRVASQTETLGGATTEKVYAYDVRGRLISVTTDGIVSEWYTYDLNGNRTNSMNGAAIYDAQDRMTAGLGLSFSYDLNGSLTNRQPTAYGLQPMAYSLWPTAYGLQPMAYSLQPSLTTSSASSCP